MVCPCSKYKTFHEVLPLLKDPIHYSYDQLLDALEFIGNDYHKFIEIFNEQLKSLYKINTDKRYFDAQISILKLIKKMILRKGPSKENRKDPIVGMGLLLDANQIPIGMKLYPGNESEKPILRDIINDLKKNHID